MKQPKTGEYVSGTVDYWNKGINGGKPGGSATMSDGRNLKNIPPDAQRVVLPKAEIKPVAHTPAEADVIARTKRELPQMAAKYLEAHSPNGVPTVATDAAKLMFPEFKKDPMGGERTVHAAAFAVKEAALKTALAAPVDPAKRDVLITTGSPGSGKTSMQTLGGERPGVGLQVETIADDLAEFSQLIDDVLASGRRPAIEWVHVDRPGKTVNRMLDRAMGKGERPGIGRTVAVDYMAKSYADLPRVLAKVREKYGDRVTLRVIDNSGAPEKMKATDDAEKYLAAKPDAGKVKEEMDEALASRERAGEFDGERGKAVLKAAKAPLEPKQREPKQRDAR